MTALGLLLLSMMGKCVRPPYRAAPELFTHTHTYIQAPFGIWRVLVIANLCAPVTLHSCCSPSSQPYKPQPGQRSLARDNNDGEKHVVERGGGLQLKFMYVSDFAQIKLSVLNENVTAAMRLALFMARVIIYCFVILSFKKSCSAQHTATVERNGAEGINFNAI